MVGSSYDQKPYRRSMIETWGATVHRSPSDRTESGRAQAEHTTGSFELTVFPGGHFFVHTAASQVLAALGDALNAVA